MTDTLRRSHVGSAFGQLHLVECGVGEPVLMLLMMSHLAEPAELARRPS